MRIYCAILPMPTSSSNRIRLLRQLRTPRWSQAELAARAGCHTDEIGCYERGDRVPSVHVAMRIAEALGVSVEVVFGGA